jgi:hypothetical protein
MIGDSEEEQGGVATVPQPTPKRPPSIELTLAQQANRAIEAGADPHDVTDRLGTMLKHLRANPEHAAAGSQALASGADPAAVTARVWSLAQPSGGAPDPAAARPPAVPGIAAASTAAAPNQAGRRSAMAAEPALLGTGALRALEQGATFGFGDELNAGVRAAFTREHFADALRDERAQNSAYANAHELANLGAELGGGAATLGLGGPVLRAAGAGVDAVIGTGRLARLTKLLGSGATVGGVAGAGSAEGGLSDRATGAAEGAAAGALTAGGLSLAGKVVSPLAAALLDRSGLRAPATEVAPIADTRKPATWTQRIAGTAGVGSVQDRADALVNRVATKGGRTIDDIRTAALAASPDKPVVLADLAGEGAQQLAAGARGYTEAAASTKVPAILRGRAEGSGTRLSADMTSASGAAPVNPYELANQMSEARRKQANQLYANAYAHGKVDDATIDELLKLPYFKDAYGFAKNLAKLEGRQLPERITQVVEKGTPPPAPPGFSDEQWATMRARVPNNAELNPPDVVKEVHETVPDVEALDMVKRGIDAHIEKNLARNSIDKAAAVKLQQRLDQFLTKVDAAVPEYGQARAAYHESSRMLEALEKGRKAINRSARGGARAQFSGHATRAGVVSVRAPGRAQPGCEPHPRRRADRRQARRYIDRAAPAVADRERRALGRRAAAPRRRGARHVGNERADPRRVEHRGKAPRAKRDRGRRRRQCIADVAESGFARVSRAQIAHGERDARAERGNGRRGRRATHVRCHRSRGAAPHARSARGGAAPRPADRREGASNPPPARRRRSGPPRQHAMTTPTTSSVAPLPVAPMPTTPLWLDILRSPAILLAAIGIFVRWVVAPALATYTRRELQAELTQLAQFPRYVERLDRVEVAIEQFAGVPEALARIEERIDALVRGRHE